MNKFSKTLAYAGVGLVSAPIVVPLAFATYVSYKATQFAFKHYKITAAGILGAGALMYSLNNDSFKEHLAQGTNMIHEQYHAAQLAFDEKKFEYEQKRNEQKILSLEENISLLSEQNKQLASMNDAFSHNTLLSHTSSSSSLPSSYQVTSPSFTAQNPLFVGICSGLLGGAVVGGSLLYVARRKTKPKETPVHKAHSLSSNKVTDSVSSSSAPLSSSSRSSYSPSRSSSLDHRREGIRPLYSK